MAWARVAAMEEDISKEIRRDVREGMGAWSEAINRTAIEMKLRRVSEDLDERERR